MEIMELYNKINILREELNNSFYIDYINDKRNNKDTIRLSKELDELITLYTKYKVEETRSTLYLHCDS